MKIWCETWYDDSSPNRNKKSTVVPIIPLSSHLHRQSCIVKEEAAGQINPLWSTWVISIIPVAPSPVSTIYSSLLPRQPLYLAVGSSFEEAGPGKFAGTPGNEGDVNWSAVYQKLCSCWVKEEWQYTTDNITQSLACKHIPIFTFIIVLNLSV